MKSKEIVTCAGPLTVAVDNGSVVLCKWGRAVIAGQPSESDDALLDEAGRQLDEYFSGVRRVFTLPLLFEGSEFQKAVWRCTSKIPYGATATYGDIARAVSSPGAARAVGMALGANPLHILVPCHRVVATNGAGGYAAGLPTKLSLLALESDFGV